MQFLSWGFPFSALFKPYGVQSHQFVSWNTYTVVFMFLFPSFVFPFVLNLPILLLAAVTSLSLFFLILSSSLRIDASIQYESLYYYHHFYYLIFRFIFSFLLSFTRFLPKPLEINIGNLCVNVFVVFLGVIFSFPFIVLS